MATTVEPTAPYALPQEFEDFRETIRKMVVEKVAPRAAEIDEKAEYPRDIRELFASHDLLGLRTREVRRRTSSVKRQTSNALSRNSRRWTCASKDRINPRPRARNTTPSAPP